MFFSVFFSILINVAFGKEVCFAEFGCFNDLPPYGGTFQRPIGFLPQHPTIINTTFILFNSKNWNGVPINSKNLNILMPELPIKIITHGFLNTNIPQLELWVMDMKNAFLNYENVNVILTNWGSFTAYSQATANIQVKYGKKVYLIK